MSSFSFTPLLNISWKLINNLNRILKKGQNLLGWLTFWYYLGFWPVLELKQLRTMILYENLKLLNSYTFLYFVHQWSLVKFKFLPIFHSLIPVHYYIITAPPLFTSLSIPDPSLRTLCKYLFQSEEICYFNLLKITILWVKTIWE